MLQRGPWVRSMSATSITLFSAVLFSFIWGAQSSSKKDATESSIETRLSVLRSMPRDNNSSKSIPLGWAIERRSVLTESQTRTGGPKLTAEEEWSGWVASNSDVCSQVEDNDAVNGQQQHIDMDSLMEVVSGWSYTEEEDDDDPGRLPGGAPTTFLLPDNRHRLSQAGGVISGSLWSSAVAASILLQSPHMREMFHGKQNLLELGSGLGLGGLAAAGMTASWLRRCVLTDADEQAMRELRTTVERNMPEETPAPCAVQKVDWYEFLHDEDATPVDERSDVLIATDVAYNPKLVSPFLSTAKAHLRLDDGLMLVVGQANRKAHWELYRCLRDGCDDNASTRHHRPWKGTTQMLLYELVVGEWDTSSGVDDATLRSATENVEQVDVVIPIAVIVHTTRSSNVDSSLGQQHYDYTATYSDWKQSNT